MKFRRLWSAYLEARRRNPPHTAADVVLVLLFALLCALALVCSGLDQAGIQAPN